ncbi:hypothetical protein QQZ08_005143 [Neonectria magnoliae]|uniref:Uncharacterized protein n=1 Tax=Neonectria magnoliae TaxID=2732573 RepID=A0ABR1I6F1_9HYPO
MKTKSEEDQKDRDISESLRNLALDHANSVPLQKPRTEARRKVRNEKQNLKSALKQQIRDEWTAEQAVDDIERQFQGIGFAKQAAVDTSSRPQRPA